MVGAARERTTIEYFWNEYYGTVTKEMNREPFLQIYHKQRATVKRQKKGVALQSLIRYTGHVSKIHPLTRKHPHPLVTPPKTEHIHLQINHFGFVLCFQVCPMFL